MSAPALTGLDLTPGGGAAPGGRRVLAQAAFDARLLLGNGEQLLVSLVLPVLALLLLVRAPLAALGLPPELQALPRADQVSDFHCVTGWSVQDVHWGGVRFRDLLAAVEEELAINVGAPASSGRVAEPDSETEADEDLEAPIVAPEHVEGRDANDAGHHAFEADDDLAVIAKQQS